ncbi:MAG: 1-acyl-sn-glycerol-3-phosphate acyltransferase [Propionibacteriaceae bacterium]|nr:1-acyl-sn-glycerol-3-phosphate acyltransferase [Propionibacteriaceae bacterium]
MSKKKHKKHKKRIQVVSSHEENLSTAPRVIAERVIDETYPYHRPNLWWHIISGFFYYVIAPIPVFVVSRAYGMKFINRSVVRATGGCYLYGNHSHWTDVFIPYLLAFPRRAYVVAGPTAFSVPLARHVVPMVGGIPLNSTEEGKLAFRKALGEAVHHHCPVAILPETHLWPYFNGIRDYNDFSFTYPVRTEATTVAYVVTYRQRRWLKKRKPRLTITVSDPIKPAFWEDSQDPKKTLRDEVHTFMSQTCRDQSSYAWITYTLDSAGGQGRDDSRAQGEVL